MRALIALLCVVVVFYLLLGISVKTFSEKQYSRADYFNEVMEMR